MAGHSNVALKLAISQPFGPLSGLLACSLACLLGRTKQTEGGRYSRLAKREWFEFPSSSSFASQQVNRASPLSEPYFALVASSKEVNANIVDCFTFQ